MATELNQREKDVFDAIRSSSQVALLRAQFGEKDVAVLCIMDDTGDKIEAFPLALILDDTLMDYLTHNGQALQTIEKVDVTH